jgi:hypothetical protein
MPHRPDELATPQAIDYMLTRQPALTRFLDDGRISLSNNAADRALRGSPWGAGHGCSPGPIAAAGGAAAIYTLIATARLNGIDPQAWPADVLARIADNPAAVLGEWANAYFFALRPGRLVIRTAVRHTESIPPCLGVMPSPGSVSRPREPQVMKKSCDAASNGVPVKCETSAGVPLLPEAEKNKSPVPVA